MYMIKSTSVVLAAGRGFIIWIYAVLCTVLFAEASGVRARTFKDFSCRKKAHLKTIFISAVAGKERKDVKISVVIPMYNEHSIVCDTIKSLDAQLRSDFGAGEYEMIFVDDGSTDGCRDSALLLASEYPALRVLGYSPNRGKGYAVRCGMLSGRGDFILFTDCDLAYGTAVIKEFYDRFSNGAGDVIIGSRAIHDSGYEGYTFKRKVMSKAYMKYLSVVAGFDHTDSQCGIKGFSKDAAFGIFSVCTCERWAFDLEALLFAKDFGFNVSEVPVRIINHRDSKINPVKDAIRMTKEVRRIKKERKNRLKNEGNKKGSRVNR